MRVCTVYYLCARACASVVSFVGYLPRSDYCFGFLYPKLYPFMDMEKMFTYSVEIEIYWHEYARVHVFFFFFCVHLPCSCFYVTHMKEIFVQTIVVFDGLWTYEGGRRKTTNDEIVIVDEETTRNYDWEQTSSHRKHEWRWTCEYWVLVIENVSRKETRRDAVRRRRRRR